MSTKRFPYIPDRGRIVSFDALRSFIIIMVIVGHASMTYMTLSPEYWYVRSAETSNFFNVIINVTDLCLMSVMFFLSGYFTPASYVRKGVGSFVKDKILHIALPFVLGTLIIVPATKLLVGNITMSQMLSHIAENPFYLFNEQEHMWFLGVLLLLFAGYTLFALIKPPTSERRTSSANKGRRALLLSVVISLLAAVLILEFFASYTLWVDFAFFTVRPIKAAAYICIFILGAYAWKNMWFTQGGWMPGRKFWFTLTPIICALYILIQILIYVFNLEMMELPRLTIDICGIFATVLFLLLLGIRLQKTRLVAWLGSLLPYSYGIYWIHSIPTIGLLFLVNDVQVSIYIKFVLVCVVGFVVSLLLTKYFLKKLPFIKRIF